MKLFENFIKWANEQVFKINPPKEQHLDHVEVQAKIVPAKKPRKKKETPNVTS